MRSQRTVIRDRPRCNSTQRNTGVADQRSCAGCFGMSQSMRSGGRGSSDSVLNRRISTASEFAACSTMLGAASHFPSASVRITTHYFAFIVGERICAFSTSRTEVCPVRASLSCVHRAAHRNPSARVSRPDLLLKRSRPASKVGLIRRLLQPATRSRWTGWPNAPRGMLYNCSRTGESSSLRMAIRLFGSLPHTNCCVISISPWTGH
jgi:hypothetical protein